MVVEGSWYQFLHLVRFNGKKRARVGLTYNNHQVSYEFKAAIAVTRSDQ